jgi:putative membrane-bound dehydrogenase-like protein
MRSPIKIVLLWTLLVVASSSCCVAIHAAPPTAPETHPALSPTAALATFSLPEGFVIQLVAAEPDLVNPMTMALDEQGRIYVSLAHTYRYGAKGAPVESPSNPVVRLELNADGRVARRSEVASGFADPVMGLAVRDGRLWATNLNHVFTAELNEDGQTGQRQTIVQDAETPWNPFGMYRVAFGPDGLVYLCVGDHPTKLSGPNNKVAVRGSTGAVFRFKPDGSDIELLVQGMRAPFSFDIDPFGQLWVLSNGEGNPNRLIHAIAGGDYHFQTRAVDWPWLAGKHPLAPPVWENPPGAHTTVLAYYSSAFPDEYWGNLLVSNWGVHGFPSANHVILRHVVDQRGELVKTEPFLTTTDPRFRPTQIALAPDGNLYLLDWYGMDDENDLTGRLYKISYVGKEAASQTSANEIAANAGLASRHHLTRQRTREALLAEGPAAAEKLAQQLAEPDALAAAESLWTLRQSAWSNAASIMQRGLQHPDWRVRRLAIQLLRERDAHSAALEELVDDPDPAVRLEAAVGLSAPAERLSAVAKSLRAGAAKSPRLRYRAALEVARLGEQADFENLVTDVDAEVRLAGLIALDEAFHEGVRKEAARAALVGLISQPGNSPLVELLAVAERWPHPSFEQPVIAALKRDLSAQETIRGVAVLRRLKLSSTVASGDTLNRFWHRVANNEVPLVTRDEKLGTLAILALDQLQPDMFVLLGRLMRDEDAEVRAETHHVLTTIGVANQVCIELCWQLVGDNAAPLEQRLETIVSLAQIEQQLPSRAWQELLASPSREVALVALRCLRNHVDQPAVTELIEKVESRLADRGAEYQAALKTREQFLAISTGSQAILAQLYAQEDDPVAARRKEDLRARLLERQQRGDPLLGRLVFRSQVCSRCHRSGGQAELSGPPLDGVAATNTVEYLIDSILYPSKTIKTGFMLELIVTQDGRMLVGGVARDGDELVVTSPTGTTDRVALENVEQRRQMNRSLMPESLDLTMSEPELLDLVAYLATLRERHGEVVTKSM